MPWFKVDDGFAVHPKALKAGNAACGLWVRAGSWSMQQLTDGFIPDHVLPTLGTKAEAKRLVDAGLWERAVTGYVFHEWEWGWQCPCGDEDRGWSSATEAQESLDQHAAFCIES